MPICSKCKQDKPPKEFPKGNKKNGLGGWCKECEHKRNKIYRSINKEKIQLRMKNYHKNNKNRIKEYNLKILYSLLLDDYIVMLSDQDGKCKICREPMIRPCVDHNHKTGKVRGLLCQKCNATLGLVDENINILLNMITYLKEGENVC